MKTLRSILDNTAEISKRLEGIENAEIRLETRLGEVENRLSFVEERFKAPQTNPAIQQIQTKIIESLSRAEENVYRKVESLQQKQGGEVTLNNLAEELHLDYRTVAGYTNRLVKFGILNERWDPVRRANLYWVSKKNQP